MSYSDDEGSEEEPEEGEDEEDEEEYDEDEEENDEDYEDEEGEEDEDAESPSYFYGNNPMQQPAWNNFQFGAPKTSAAQQESASGLSSMIANFNICSPFSFGSQSTTEVIRHFFQKKSFGFSLIVKGK